MRSSPFAPLYLSVLFLAVANFTQEHVKNALRNGKQMTGPPSSESPFCPLHSFQDWKADSEEGLRGESKWAPSRSRENACVCVRVYQCAHDHVAAGGQCQLPFPLRCCPLCFFEPGLLTGLQLCDVARLAAQWLQGPPCLCFPSTRIY